MPSLLVSALMGLTGVGLTSFMVPKFKSALTQNPFSTSNLAANVNIASGCAATATASCHNTTSVSNLCCFEAPGVIKA